MIPPPPKSTLLPYTTLFRSLPRPRRAARRMARQRRGDPRPDHHRPVRGVQRLPHDAGGADDRVRLRSEEATAELQLPFNFGFRIFLSKYNYFGTSMYVLQCE